MRALHLTLLFLLLACGPKKPPPSLSLVQEHASDTVDIDVKLDEYTIEGASTSELRAQMNQLGPKDDRGDTYDGYARWHIGWKYGFDRSGEGCALANPRVEVSLFYTMPRASEDQGWSSSLSERWSGFVEALWEHELGHGELAVEAGEQILAAMEELGEARDCDALRSNVSGIGQALLGLLADTQHTYDDETEHGRTQGAKFP